MKAIESWLEQAKARRQERGKPLVSLCYAQSLDGCLTARRGQPTALSGPSASRLTHRLRAWHDAILVGSGTVLADNPRLNVRLVKGADPQPVILDSRLRTPPGANLLSGSANPVWIAATATVDPARRAALEAAGARLLILPAAPDGAGVSLPALLGRLGELGIASLMVEGGAQVITGFLSQRLADLAVITIAPLFLGGLHAIQIEVSLPEGGAFPRLTSMRSARLGEDLVIWGNLA